MPGSLDETLATARRERPPSLPRGFASEVIARAEGSSSPAIRREALSLCAVSVLAAAAIGFAAAGRERDVAPPPLEIFGAGAPTASFPVP